MRSASPSSSVAPSADRAADCGAAGRVVADPTGAPSGSEQTRTVWPCFKASTVTANSPRRVAANWSTSPGSVAGSRGVGATSSVRPVCSQTRRPAAVARVCPSSPKAIRLTIAGWG